MLGKDGTPIAPKATEQNFLIPKWTSKGIGPFLHNDQRTNRRGNLSSFFWTIAATEWDRKKMAGEKLSAFTAVNEISSLSFPK